MDHFENYLEVRHWCPMLQLSIRMGIIRKRLNDKRSLLVAALVAVLQTLKANPYGLNLLNSSFLDIEDYTSNDIDKKNLLQFAESCYRSLLKSYTKTIA